MNARNRWMRAVMILAVGAIGLAFAVKMSAQVKTSTQESVGQATHQVQVERAEVISVYGNDLILKMEDGTIRHIANVPESARATVDGREVGIHDVRPGMHLQKTITTTTTDKVITTVKSVTGKVWHVNPPLSVILTLENGENQAFKIPNGQKFNVDGKETDAWGLKKGMKVSVTKVIEEPLTQVEQQARLSGHMPPPPPAPPADTPILIAVAAPVPAPTAATAELPKTASSLPFIAIVGLLLVASSLGVHSFRKLRA